MSSKVERLRNSVYMRRKLDTQRFINGKSKYNKNSVNFWRPFNNSIIKYLLSSFFSSLIKFVAMLKSDDIMESYCTGNKS